MLATEELLEPITPENPCGADLTYDPAFQELESEIRGKPETQFSPAEEPHWPSVVTHALELFQRSKDLRIAVILAGASLKTEGVTGARNGLTLLHGLLEKYWPTLYPLLDPEDNNDPLQRVNILAGLITPIGSFDDPLKFLERLRFAPLCKSPRFGIYNLADISGNPAPAEGKTPPSVEQVQAAFRDTEPTALAAVHAAITDSIRIAKSISDTLQNLVGAQNSIDWAPLLSTLSQMEKAVAPFTAAPAEVVTGGSADSPAEVPVQTSGAIRSREDVVQTLERICEFYQRTEPSSPVPLLLRRAQRLAGKNFVEIVKDLSPDALNALRIIAGEELNG